MKNIKLIFLSSCMAITLWSCSEAEGLKPLVSDDGVAPSSVTNATVINFAGGSEITYTLPSDSDLLYVAAEYTRTENGALNTIKSSSYNNNLLVEGFAEEKAYEVKLYAVDASENRSEPTVVTINPEKPPLDYIFESMTAAPAFGGMRLYWENPFKGLVSVEVSYTDEFGEPQLADVFYTDAAEGEYTVRGFDTSEREFVIVVKDRYGNVGDVNKFLITPLFEELIDRLDYKGVVQTHDSPTAFGATWALTKVIDGNTGSAMHTATNYVDPDGELPEYLGQNVQMFTIDLGQQVKISRIKFYDRPGKWLFTHGNTRRYEIWGATTLNADGSLDGWTKLVANGEVVKPSGDPGYGVVTAADIETASLGWDAEADLNAPPVQFIRFVNIENWLGSTFLHMAEIEAYGEKQ